MEKRLLLFITLSLAVLATHMALMRWLNPPQPAPKKADAVANADADQAKDRAAEPAAEKPIEAPRAKADPAQAVAEREALDQVAEPREAAKDDADARGMPPQPDEWVALGSIDPQSPYRMMATLTSRGAAVERIELNSPRYRDAENYETYGGYLGHLSETDSPDAKGCIVHVVGDGTPAAAGGLRVGDVITAVDGAPTRNAVFFRAAMAKTRSNQTIKLSVDRDGDQKTLSIVLARRPMSVVKPEAADPLSFLMTLSALDNRALAPDEIELAGISMRTGNWKVLPRDAAKPEEVAFEYELPQSGLAIVKRYRLERVPNEAANDPNFPAYHLNFDIELRNTSDQPVRVGYQLDGPTGLPIEGWWYAMHSKISPHFRTGAGLRDVVVGFLVSHGVDHHLFGCESIIDGPAPNWRGEPIVYIGVDAQYFASVLIPRPKNPKDDWFESSTALRAGPVPADAALRRLTNVTCRVTSLPAELTPGSEPLVHPYQIFAGPKKPSILVQYARPAGAQSSRGLERLIEYGWFGWVARPMLAVLHGFHALVGNYGIAIIMLTVLVRSAMFPISYKQTLNAQKMQELQPEIKRIAEKYKAKPEERMKAQQELFRKHNYNPLSGCLPLFIQLPIFIGLYRSLSVDVELRQAPLITESLGWATNLAAPDMLWRWEPYLPQLLAGPLGWLGPYFNILPCFTIALFLIQQKMFMPPPTDEQTEMQQKIMKYMMVFIGVMFFKVASGLCVYFIASSLWGIAERKLLPKATAAKGTDGGAGGGRLRKLFSIPPLGGNGNGASATSRKKQRERR